MNLNDGQFVRLEPEESNFLATVSEITMALQGVVDEDTEEDVIRLVRMAQGLIIRGAVARQAREVFNAEMARNSATGGETDAEAR